MGQPCGSIVSTSACRVYIVIDSGPEFQVPLYIFVYIATGAATQCVPAADVQCFFPTLHSQFHSGNATQHSRTCARSTCTAESSRYSSGATGTGHSACSIFLGLKSSVGCACAALRLESSIGRSYYERRYLPL